MAQQTIEEIKLLPLGSIVTTTGTITSGSEWGQLRYMQDANAGIAIFSSSLSTTIPGDSIRITGTLSKYRGELQVSSVISHQTISQGRTVTSILSENILESSLPSFESRKIIFTCVGIASCEESLEEGWYRMYDDHGNIARLWIDSESPLNPVDFEGKPFLISGIWTKFEDQYQLRCYQIVDASEGSCKLLPEGQISFEDGTPELIWNVSWVEDMFIEYGISDFSSMISLSGQGAFVRIDFGEFLPDGLFQARLVAPKENGGFIYSIPTWIGVSNASASPFEILFNRSVDTAFSDGSHPFATGASVIETDIIQRIDQAVISLDVAMYNTSRAPIVQALNRAVQRGVMVRYIADDETSNSALDGSLSFEVRYRSGDGIMHNKFIIADPYTNPWVWTGSTNFSTNQLSIDPNHAYVIRDPAFSLNYLKEFEELWGTNASPPERRYGDFKMNNTSHVFKIDDVLIESYFSPSDETNCHIIEAIQSADHHIEIGLLLLTKEDLVDEIIALHQQGVQVRIILEDEESSAVALARLRNAGVPVVTHDFGPIFHHKYAMIDEGYPDSDPLVITGSHNWTWSADNINDENTLIIHDQSVTNIFRQEFEARWEELNPTSSIIIGDDEIGIYPNPASSHIIISNSGSIPYAITLWDALGRAVLSTHVEAQNNNNISIEKHLSSGVYTLMFTNQHHQFSRRVCIVR